MRKVGKPADDATRRRPAPVAGRYRAVRERGVTLLQLGEQVERALRRVARLRALPVPARWERNVDLVPALGQRRDQKCEAQQRTVLDDEQDPQA